ncbi:MAG: hypothetical protein K6B41_05325, partial [Butyrivibrio sp.]|nr:hypothetical protein [Butyrivibrio sp.]
MIKNTTIKIITSLLLIILFLFAFLIIIVNVFGINIGLILGMDNLYTTENVIGSDTEWTYLPVGEDPGIGKIWTYNDYDDSGWSHGTGPFNWENNGSDDDCPTMFIRTTFEYDDDRIEVNRINCCMSYADAIIVYLNGNVIFAGNVPDGGYKNFLDYGCAYNGEGKRKQVFCVTDLSSLIDGENTLAIEVHVSGHESKGYFDCSYVELSSEEVEEQEPDSSLVVLQAGDDESDVIVSWLS